MYDPLARCWIEVRANGDRSVTLPPRSTITIGSDPGATVVLPLDCGIRSHELVTDGTLLHLKPEMRLSMREPLPQFYQAAALGRRFRAPRSDIFFTTGDWDHWRAHGCFGQTSFCIRYWNFTSGYDDVIHWWEPHYRDENIDPYGAHAIEMHANGSVRPRVHYRKNFAPRSSVTVGTHPDCDFILPADAGIDSHPLITEGTLIHPPSEPYWFIFGFGAERVDSEPASRVGELVRIRSSLVSILIGDAATITINYLAR